MNWRRDRTHKDRDRLDWFCLVPASHTPLHSSLEQNTVHSGTERVQNRYIMGTRPQGSKWRPNYEEQDLGNSNLKRCFLSSSWTNQLPLLARYLHTNKYTLLRSSQDPACQVTNLHNSLQYGVSSDHLQYNAAGVSSDHLQYNAAVWGAFSTFDLWVNQI